jgi:hypothetical protein
MWYLNLVMAHQWSLWLLAIITPCFQQTKVFKLLMMMSSNFNAYPLKKMGPLGTGTLFSLQIKDWLLA